MSSYFLQLTNEKFLKDNSKSRVQKSNTFETLHIFDPKPLLLYNCFVTEETGLSL